jgi:aspartate racemase
VKILGIIGGLGPESTIEYYSTIIALYRERTGDGSYPQFLINSIDLNKVREFVIANDLRRLIETIVEEIEKLARAGADFGLIAANTPHLVFEQIAERSSVPLISIVEATCAAAKAEQLKKLALFGTKFTMTGEFYPKVFSREGIALVQPDSADQDYIHDKYMNELVPGKFLPETRAGLLAVVDRLKAKIDPPSRNASPARTYGEAGIDGVILAGTELPLILREPEHHGVPFLNTTTIHCQAAVTEMLS